MNCWKMLKSNEKMVNKKGILGFTLVELLVVMSIIGVLATILSSGFRSAQVRGRDAQRKSDLKELSNSLELFYSDYGRYPSDSAGSIVACPYRLPPDSGDVCSWGSGEFYDGKTTYFKEMPIDPNGDFSYYYKIVPGSENQKYQIFARLENTKDKNCLGGNCEVSQVSINCGSSFCNYAVTSSNTSPKE